MIPHPARRGGGVASVNRLHIRISKYAAPDGTRKQCEKGGEERGGRAAWSNQPHHKPGKWGEVPLPQKTYSWVSRGMKE